VTDDAAQQRDAADEGRLEPCGSIVVGKGHREPWRGRAPLAADRECSADIEGKMRARTTEAVSFSRRSFFWLGLAGAGCASRERPLAVTSPPRRQAWQVKAKNGEVVCVFTEQPGFVFVGLNPKRQHASPDDVPYRFRHPYLTITFPNDKYYRWVWPTLERATTAQFAVFSLRSQGFTVSAIP
jgi:hypothetical protein